MDKVASALVRVFEYFGSIQHLLKAFISNEVQNTGSIYFEDTNIFSVTSAVLFRGNSMAVKLISNYAVSIGKQYLCQTLQPVIQQVYNDPSNYEVPFAIVSLNVVQLDTTLMQDTEMVEANAKKLAEICEKFLLTIENSVEKCPK